MAERDQLRSELAARSRSTRVDAAVEPPDEVAALADDVAESPGAVAELADDAAESPGAASAELADDAAESPGAVAAEPDDVAASEPDDAPDGAPDDDAAAGSLDLEAARSVLGRVVELDDLTVVEGIGPKIAELLAAIGITTWSTLADADVATLRSMLSDAGSRYQMHDPTSWPRQAQLLAHGDWDGFTALTDELDGGR